MIHYRSAYTQEDFLQILHLQAVNHASVLPEESKTTSGFVTLLHTLEQLQEMNSPHPHILAISANEVVGYALVTSSQYASQIPLLEPLITRLHDIRWNGKEFSAYRYFVMGQICIAASYRSQGLFKGLYDSMSIQMRDDYDYIVTEINEQNIRSIKAHQSIGFEILDIHKTADSQSWHTVIKPL